MIAATILGLAVPTIGVGALGAAVLAFAYVPVIGRGLALALGIVSAGAFVYGVGFNERGALDRSDALAAQIATLNSEISNLQQAHAAALAIAADARVAEQNAEDHAAIAQQDVDAYEAELAKRPSATVCRLSDLDVVRLRGIGAARDAPPVPPTRPLNLRGVGSGPGAK